MKKRFLTLFTTVAVIATTAISTFAAAPQTEVEIKKLKPLELVEISEDEYKILESLQTFKFTPIQAEEMDEEGTIKPYWIVKNLRNQIIYKGAETEIDKYVIAPKGVNIRTSPVVLGTENKVKALSYSVKVHVVAESDNGWSLIKIDEETYFCRSEFLSLEKPKVEKRVDNKKTETSSTPTNTNNNNNSESSGSYLGNFKLTAYCNCSKCCGKWAGGPTASGKMPSAGRTVAMGGVSFGTKLLINGHVYTVEDRGTPYGHVDIYFNSHSEANAFGLRYADVYLVE